MPVFESSDHTAGLSFSQTVIGGVRVRSRGSERCYSVPSGVSVVTPDCLRVDREICFPEFIGILRRSTQLRLPYIFPIRAEHSDRTTIVRTYGNDAVGLLRVFWALHGKNVHVVATRESDQVTMNGSPTSHGFRISSRDCERVIFEAL